MAPSDITRDGAGQDVVVSRRKRRRVASHVSAFKKAESPRDAATPSIKRASRRASRFILARQTASRWHAKTRVGVFWGVFWRGCAIAAVGFGLLFVNPLVAALAVCALGLVLLRPAIAMVIFPPLSAILTSANPRVFGEGSPAMIQAPLLGISLVILAYLVFRKNLRPGKISLIFIGCVSLGGLVSMMTTTSLMTTLDALWKFCVPLAPLIFWFDNKARSVCAAKEAPYALGGIMASVVVGSFLVMMAGAGRELNVKDFQGVFWHPQTLGMMMAAASPIILFARRLPLWLRVVTIIAIATLAWLSWTRTALGAMTLAGLFVLSVWLLTKARIKLSSALRRPVQIGQGLAVVVLALGSLFYASTLEPQEYVAGETSQEILTEEAYSNARTFALYRAYQNFASKPATGIGFGVPSDPRLIDPEFEAQTIEAFRNSGGSEVLFDKGNSYLAIFEETGLVGAIFWLGLFTVLVVTACATGLAATSAAVIFCLSLFAEATAFSLGGVGMVLWASMLLCAGFGTSQQSRHRSRNAKNTNISVQQGRIQRQRLLHARGFKSGRPDLDRAGPPPANPTDNS